VNQIGGKMMAAGFQNSPKSPGNFELTGGAEDLFVALGALSSAEAARWHSKGKLIYSYQNPTGGRELPETWRRNYGLLLWQYDYDGGMPYAWQHSYGNGWNDFDHYRYKDTNFTYPSLGGPIDTTQWEGLREGIDDVRYLSTLLDAIAAAESGSKAAANARDWLNALKTSVLGQQDLADVRAQIVAQILAVKELPAARFTRSGPAASLVGALQPGASVGAGVSPEISLSATAVDDGAQRYLDVSLASEFRASVAIDWDRSLLGWWRFSSAQDPGVDLSSWDNEMSLKGDAKLAPGWFGNGVALGGDGDFVTTGDIEIAENGTATVEGWYRFRSTAMGNLANMGLFTGFYQNAFNNQLYFAGMNDHFETASLIRLNTWHHIVVTWDGDVSTGMVYVDGRPVRPTVQGPIEDVRAMNGLSVGRHTGYFGGLVGATVNTFDGDIDEVRVWSRVLSPAEVKGSYDARQSQFRDAAPAGLGPKPDWSLIGANGADQYIRQ
jgi:hypothetical protein